MNWEIEHNNFGGLRIPGVFATPTQGGFQSYDTTEAGVTAIAHQLDRYFSGATTGKPLNTLRQIVNTWAPASENPTNALLTRASQVLGASPDAPLDFSNADTRAKLIEATIRNEQGGKLPVDPSLITQVAANYTPGAAAPASGKTKMQLPPFGNTRALAQLTPQGQDPNVLPDVNVTAAANPATPYPANPMLSQLATAGYGAAADAGTDPLATIKQLARSGSAMNPSAMLANMAAGALGGRGPAQSLAGFFGGLGKTQQESGSDLMKLAQMSMLYGPMAQAKALTQRQSAAAAMARNHNVPLGTAYQTLGLPVPEGFNSYDEMNDKSPLPAGVQKTVDTNVKQIGDLSNLQQRYSMAADQLKNGEFHVDALSRAKYAAILADPTGLAAQAAPETLQEAMKYNAFTQLRSQAQQVVQNAQKGALSDFRSSEAGKTIMGGYGSINDKAAEQHFRQLGNATAMDINNARNQIASAYKTSGHKGVPKDFYSTFNLPETPLQNTPTQQIYDNPYGNNTQPVAAPVGQPTAAPSGALPTATHKDGRKAVWDGQQWVIQQ